MKIGIVIQGPVTSRGRNFESSNHITFNSSLYIKDLYEYGTKCGCDVILVTWEGEDISQLQLPQTDVFQFREDMKLLSSNFLNNRKSSKYKQIFLVRRGLEILKIRNCDVVIKVRTDQLFDLKKLVDYLCDPSFRLENKILTLFADSRIIDSWVDFTFASKIDYLISTLDSYVSKKELFSSIHRDFFYHVGRQHKSFLQNVIYKCKLPYRPKKFSKSQVKLIRYIWETYFTLMPIEILQSLEWRGSKINFNVSEEFFKGADTFDFYLESLGDLEFEAGNRSFNFLSLDLLTILFPGSVADNLRAFSNGLGRRIRYLTRYLHFNN